MKCDGTCAETIFRLSAKRTSPFKSAGWGASVQSTAGSRGVRISDSNAGYTMFRGSVKSTGYPSIHQFPLHFPSSASPCAFTFQLESITEMTCVSAEDSLLFLCRKCDTCNRTCSVGVCVSFFFRTRSQNCKERLLSVDKKNQLDVTFCILYFSSNSCSTCFGQPCAHHQELTTA